MAWQRRLERVSRGLNSPRVHGFLALVSIYAWKRCAHAPVPVWATPPGMSGRRRRCLRWMGI